MIGQIETQNNCAYKGVSTRLGTRRSRITKKKKITQKYQYN